MAYRESSLQRDWDLEVKEEAVTRRLTNDLRDLSLSFASAPGLGNTDVVIKDTKGTIVQGVKLLLKTKPGEIPFQPQFFLSPRYYFLFLVEDCLFLLSVY